MRRNECRRFEEAIASESALGAALLQHAETCPECRAFAELADLSAAPEAADEHDPFVKEVLAAAAEVAAGRAARGDRGRKTAAVAIGIGGYILGAAALLLGPSSDGSGPSGLARLLEPQVFAAPPPDLTSIMAVLVVSVVWVAVLALATRSRWAGAAES